MSKGSPVSGKKRGLPVGGSALPRSDKKNHSDESRSYTLGDEDDGEGLEERKDLGEAKKLGKYQLGNLLGRGYYGRVFSAINTDTGDFVAIKQISADKITKKQLTEMMSEVNILGKLRHPNIVKYLDFIRQGNSLNLVLEFVEGGSLRNLILQFGQFPESLIANYARQVISGIQYLHSEGVLHRDIKAANILITKDGTCKLADFGMATQTIKEDTTKRYSVKGTPYWMAPEVIEMSDVTSASDIWSLGCTVMELYTGNPPYSNLGPMGALFRIVQDAHPPLPTGLSSEMHDFLMACLQKDPTKRCTAEQLAQHPWLGSKTSPKSPPTKTTPIAGETSSTPNSTASARERRMTLFDARQDIIRHNSVLNVKALIQNDANYAEGVSIEVSDTPSLQSGSPVPSPSVFSTALPSSGSGKSSPSGSPANTLRSEIRKSAYGASSASRRTDEVFEYLCKSVSELLDSSGAVGEAKKTEIFEKLNEVSKRLKDQEKGVTQMMEQFKKYTANVELLSNENSELQARLKNLRNCNQDDDAHWVSKIRILEDSFETEMKLAMAIYGGVSIKDLTNAETLDGDIYMQFDRKKWRKVWMVLRDNFLVQYKTHTTKDPMKVIYLKEGTRAERIELEDASKEFKKHPACFRVIIGHEETTDSPQPSSRKTPKKAPEREVLVCSSTSEAITDSWVEAIRNHRKWYDKPPLGIAARLQQRSAARSGSNAEPIGGEVGLPNSENVGENL